MSSPYPAETNGGVVTSWIPLTTSFASVSGCSNSYMLEGPSLVAFDPGYGLSINSEATCQPSAVTTWWEQGRLGGGSGPGHTAVSILPLTCPDGWSTVATSISDSTTTQAMCCPSWVNTTPRILCLHANIYTKEAITWQTGRPAQSAETACQVC